ncbi:hypothetical protein HK20_06410 [Acetobacter sp. DsW_54]|nr:hypothetical protein HK20_06410 [Acetobacter sp. DsW_54]
MECWNKVMVNEPAMIFKDGTPNPMNYPGAVLGGACEDSSFILGVQKNRIDMWITPLGNKLPENGLPPILTNVEAAVSSLREKSKILSSSISCNRFGVITNLGKIYDSEWESVEHFNKDILKNETVPKNSTEVKFKYNVPVKEEIDGTSFRVNNIFSMNSFKQRNVNLRISDEDFSSSSFSAHENYGIGKNIDLNTSIFKEPISTPILSKIIDKFMDDILKYISEN